MNVLLNNLEAVDGQRGHLTVATVSENGHLEVHLTDTGPGIPKQDLSHVLDPFYTTQPTPPFWWDDMSYVDVLQRMNGSFSTLGARQMEHGECSSIV